MSRSPSARCSKRRRVEALAQRLHEAEAARPALVRRRRRPAEIPLSFAQRRLWFLHRLEGPSATYNIPMALRLTGALDEAALEAALGDVVERHESLRTIFPDTLGVPRQQILDASAARPVLEVTSATEAELGGSCSPLRRGLGFDLSSEPPLRAHLFVLGEREHVLLLVLHHIAGDGWSWGPLARDLGRAYAARCRGSAPAFAPCRCNMPTTRCGSTRCWARRAIRTARWRGSSRSGRARSKAFPISSSCRPTGRGRRCRAIAATVSRCTIDAGTARRSAGSRPRQPGEPVHGAAGRCSRPCSPGWAPAPTSPSAARLRAAPTARSTIWSASSSTPWCCAPTPSAIRASAN